MASFSYRALDVSGVPTQGEIEAEDKAAVAAQLRGRGLIVLDIEEQQAAAGIDLFDRFKKVKSQQLTVATRQLSVMISSGMSLLRTLYVIEEQVENDKLRDAFTQVRQDVEAGLAFSDSLAKHPDIF